MPQQKDLYLQKLEEQLHKTPLWIALSIILAGIIAWLAHWEIFEYDVFWLVRAGHDIMQDFGVQSIETWSFTVKGQPWYHFQWLSSVIMYWVSLLSDNYTSIPWLRSGLVFAWMTLILQLIRMSAKPASNSLFMALLICPWIYLICWLRLQMRPDLFAAVCYVALLFIWCKELSAKTRRLASATILLLWANLHAGIVPVGIFIFIIALLGELPFNKLLQWTVWKEVLPWILFAISIWFLTPQGFNVLKVLQDNYSTIGNPDLQPFSFKLLLYGEGGWIYSLWFAYLMLIIIIIGFTPAKALPGIYKNKFFTIIIGVALTILTFQRVRVIIYQTVFFVPIVSCGLAWLLRLDNATAKNLKKAAIFYLACLIFFWVIAIPNQKNISPAIDSKVSSLWNPVEAGKFILKIKPQNNMLNHYNFGGYFIGALPEYPVAIDGRELPFLKFEAEMRAAKVSPEKYAKFLTKHKINFAVEATPPAERYSLQSFAKYKEYYPNEEWALVYVDLLAQIYLRRTSEHFKTILEWEGKGGFLGDITGNKAPKGQSRQIDIRNLDALEPELRDSVKQVLEDIKRRQNNVPK